MQPDFQVAPASGPVPSRRLRAAATGERGSLLAVWRQVWEAPDPALAHAGESGELLVAKIRAVLGLFILYIPFSRIVVEPQRLRAQIGLALVGVALVGTLVVYRVLRRHRHRQWLGFASSLLDVTLVSAALASPLVLGTGYEAPAGRAVFLIYFLAIFATSLRYDSRVCVLTGAMAVGQYAVIALLAAPRTGGAADAAPQVGWVLEESGRLILLAAASVLAAAIVVRSRELRHLSTRDPLTGVLSRGFFEERLAEEAARIEHDRETTACVMLDLDHFKRFNDSHGHAAGDEALRIVGGILRHSFRASDIVARYGGEEFIVVVPGLDPALVHERVERIRRQVAAAPVALGDGVVARFTVSIGYGCYPADGESLAAVLEVADGRLYAAKTAGRDRVVGARAAAAG